ncbi:hypothetical protein CBR_g30994 [Chara braunii]|uniref:Uncharacterized protein n=1 Tax=Chara braunii TaxID=69332 RepID=A0A388LE86_CHABU|nr:hypothetical protein CBR_g30994 [Chara braunii]|eukprot:GBG80533.1 hypothetical protein CBR_g30994 [Chara braunii]
MIVGTASAATATTTISGTMVVTRVTIATASSGLRNNGAEGTRIAIIRDDRFDKIYGLFSEQAEEREWKQQEAAKLELLEAEKKRLQAEEEKNAQARKERELQETRLGKIVRVNMKSVCESVLGKKVEIPDEDETEISRVRRELEELKARCAGEKAESSLEALRREKDALQRAHSKSSEEDILRKEIEALKARNDKGRTADLVSEGSRSNEIAALRLQIHELEVVRAALQDHNNELFTRKSPPAEPDMGKQMMVPIGEAVYTPKDLDALHKAFKKAQAGEEMANREVQALKQRMAHMGAHLLTKQRQSARRPLMRKTTPRNLRPTLSAIQVENVELDKEADPVKVVDADEAPEKPEEAQLRKLQEEENGHCEQPRRLRCSACVRRKGLRISNSIKLERMSAKSEPEKDLHNGSRIRVIMKMMTMIKICSMPPLRKTPTTSENAP